MIEGELCADVDAAGFGAKGAGKNARLMTRAAADHENPGWRPIQLAADKAQKDGGLGAVG